MYSQSSPRTSRQDIGGGVQSPSKGPTGSVALRASPAAGVVLSPGLSRRLVATGNQGGRSGSPLTVNMDGMQQLNPSAYGLGQSPYLMDNLSGSPGPSPASRSPFQSPAHSRSSSMTSVKSLLRDRSLDRTEREHMQTHHHGHGAERHGAMIRDRSLDRQLDRHHREMDRGHYAFAGRDRPSDREGYPHMGARSLDRDHHQHMRSNLVRSRSIDHEYLLNQASFLPSSQELRHARETLILDLQSQIAELNKECACLHQELEATKEKLGSSMNSIKTFWSPELKKERMIRKEEMAKLATLTEQLKLAHAENQRYNLTIQQLEEDVQSGRSSLPSSPASVQSSSLETTTLKREKERYAKEILILRKTVDEMELRIEMQKQTLSARDESIKKLLEMLQSKGLAVKHLEEDRQEVERLRAKVVEEDRKVKKLESMLEQKDKDINALKQDAARHLENERVRRDSGSSDALHAIIENKDSRIQGLEKEVRILEDEMLRLREEGATRPDLREGDMQVEMMKSQERLLKAKLENMKEEVSKKEAELCSLRTQMETMMRQGDDKEQHILVLREQITAKDQQASMVQADLEILRDRLEEKDSLIDKKAKQVLTLQNEKKRVEGEMAELRDHMDIKERKINVLHRKIENLEDMFKDKDMQLASVKARLSSMHADQSSSDSALSCLEESLSEKERQIERLKSQREQADREHQEEVEVFQHTTKDLKSRIDELQVQLEEKQHSVLELRDEVSELKTEKMHKEAHINRLDSEMSRKSSDVAMLEDKVKQLKEEKTSISNQKAEETDSKMAAIQKEAEEQREQATKTQSEVDRLLDILKEMENEKYEKDKQIKELQEQVKDYKQKMGTLKRNQQTEKKKNAQLLEEARKREDTVSEDASHLKSDIMQRDERIEELEEALRESVKITAQREMVMATQQMKLNQVEKQMKSTSEELDKVKKESSDHESEVKALKKEMEERSSKLHRLQTERKKHMEEVYEMKQEAILAAISEKDAHIAVLETGGPSKQTAQEVERLNKEKEKLQQQLKQLTQSRMKLLQGENQNDTKETSMTKKLKNSTTEQDTGIWA